MEQKEDYTLRDWEELLSSLFEEIRLISELPVGDVERVLFAQHIHALVEGLGLTWTTNILERSYPRVFVTYLA